MLAIDLQTSDGKIYTITDDFWAVGDYSNSPYDGSWQYTEGNFGCDCNRSQFIKQQCDPTFEKLECGDTIKLVGFRSLEPTAEAVQAAHIKSVRK